MQVVEFKEFGKPSKLHLAERPLPQADANNVVVRMESRIGQSERREKCRGTNVANDPASRPGSRLRWRGSRRSKRVDPSGSVGTGGDVGFTRDGTHAEYIQVPVASLARKPESLSHEEAGCVGVNFVTAWCALDYARLSEGETLAVFGAMEGSAAQRSRLRSTEART